MANPVTESASGLLRRALRFFLPVHCSHCSSLLADDPIPHFCSQCWSKISLMPDSRCTRCDHPFPSSIATTYSPNHVCQPCAERPPSYTKAWTLYPYTPPLQHAIRLFKYQGKVSLAAPLAALMIARLPPLDSIDVIMPVPLHIERLRQREFNQSRRLYKFDPSHLYSSPDHTIPQKPSKKPSSCICRPTPQCHCEETHSSDRRRLHDRYDGE
jgi:predicted amidophosphoribosyltransferase